MKQNTIENKNLEENSMDVKIRSVSDVISAKTTMEGGGIPIQRAFPNGATREIDPFLLLDEMGPMVLPPGNTKGVPSHPHRGFEAVTHLLEGDTEHKDSLGNSGHLKTGDVQWMTTGSGLIHSEMPGKEMMEKGGKLHGFQLWVNLPKKEKNDFASLSTCCSKSDSYRKK